MDFLPNGFFQKKMSVNRYPSEIVVSYCFRARNEHQQKSKFENEKYLKKDTIL